MWYRDFISGSDLNSFFRFSFWYGTYLSNQLSNRKYARAFTVESLNKFYMSMDTKLREVVENKGFVAVAKAIRQSTVNLQYTPKENRKYEVRYGVAQALQVKSKTPEDLAEYIGEFIATYNAETARQTEKSGQALRANVREDELTEFYSLLDKQSGNDDYMILSRFNTTPDTNNKDSIDILLSQKDSNLLIAQYEYHNGTCKQEKFIFDGKKLKSITKVLESCNEQ